MARTTSLIRYALPLVLATTGCGSSNDPGGGGPVVDGDAGSGTDSASPGNDAAAGVDAASPDASSPGVDAGSDAPSSGIAAFGATCTGNGDCASNLCEPFRMQTVNLCTKACTVATQATDCPSPSVGTCTPKGYCRFN